MPAPKPPPQHPLEDPVLGSISTLWFLAWVAATVILCAWGSGCGPSGPPDFVTADGVEVYLQGNVDGGPTPTTTGIGEAYLIRELSRSAGYDPDKVQSCMGAGVQVSVNPTWEWTDWDGVEVYGFDNFNEIQIGIAYPDGSACCDGYVHELTHWLQWCVKGTIDPTHSDTDVWAPVWFWNNHCSEECAGVAPNP